MLQNITVDENNCSFFANSFNDDNTTILLAYKMKNSGLKGDLNPDLCNAGPVLYQLGYQTNWDVVITTFVGQL